MFYLPHGATQWHRNSKNSKNAESSLKVVFRNGVFREQHRCAIIPSFQAIGICSVLGEECSWSSWWLCGERMAGVQGRWCGDRKTWLRFEVGLVPGQGGRVDRWGRVTSDAEACTRSRWTLAPRSHLSGMGPVLVNERKKLKYSTTQQP